MNPHESKIRSTLGHEVLVYMSKHDRPVLARDIAAALERQVFTISGVLQKLEIRRAIERKAPVREGRLTIGTYALTELGRRWAALPAIPAKTPKTEEDPSIQQRAREAYKAYHVKHVERQRRMGLSEELIKDEFDLREYKGKGERGRKRGQDEDEAA